MSESPQDAIQRRCNASPASASPPGRLPTCRQCGGLLGGLRSDAEHCSARCRLKAWEAAHPRERWVSPVRSANLRAAILALLQSGSSYNGTYGPADFCRATGATWAAITPRLRELRKGRYGGHNIVRSGPYIHERGTKVYRYRLEQP